MTFFEQYTAIKQQYPECLVLMRVGDFLQCFDEDAETLARIGGLETYRQADRLTVAVPHQFQRRYIRLLVQAGIRAAVAEPAETAPRKPEVVRVDARPYSEMGIVDLLNLEASEGTSPELSEAIQAVYDRTRAKGGTTLHFQGWKDAIKFLMNKPLA